MTALTFSSEKYEIYRVGEELTLPPRSRLYRLEPEGFDSAFREGLVSYFERLANAHFVLPGVMAKSIVAEQIGGMAMSPGWDGKNYCHQIALNGLGKESVKWAGALENLTSVVGLSSLTFAPLSGLISSRGLLANHRRWCPICLQEGEQRGVAYRQLLWDVACVEACPKHRVNLVEQCKCGAAKRSRSRAPKWAPNLCIVCGAGLATIQKEAVNLENASHKRIQIAQIVADLLGSNLFNGKAHPIGRSPIVIFLKEAIETIAKGNSALLARYLGLNKSLLCEWVQGKHLPAFPRLISMAMTFECGIADILTAETKILVERSRDIEMIQRLRPTTPLQTLRPRVVRSEVERMLAETLPIDALSLSDVGRRLGVDSTSIRKVLPDLADEIVQRHRAWLTERVVRRKEERPVLYLEVARQLVAEGLRPTYRRMAERLKGRVGVFTIYEKEAFKAARRLAIEEEI